MNELRDWLKDGDPVANELPLSDADAQRMRRAIVAGSESHESPFADLVRGSWAVATVVVAVTIAVGTSRWMTPSADVRSENPAAVAGAQPEPGARRQVQLIAPRGTRVIWVFNDDFTP